MACSFCRLKVSLSHKISTFLPSTINQIRIQTTSLAWDCSSEGSVTAGQTRGLSRIYFTDGVKDVFPQVSKAIITYQPPPIALQVRNVSFSCMTPKTKVVEHECNNECSILCTNSFYGVANSEDIQEDGSKTDLTVLNPHLPYNALIPLDSLNIYFQSCNHPNLDAHLEEDMMGRQKVPVTVLSGYLDAAPYYVYFMGDEKGISSNNSKQFLSEVERQSLMYALADKPHQFPENTGRPSEEKLQVVFAKLSQSLPTFFVKPHDYSVYHKNVIFENNIRRVTTHGIVTYVQQLSLLRILGHFKYAHVKMTVLKITQHPEDGTIRVRWRISGVSGLRALFFFWKFRLWEWKKLMQTETEWLDGFSIFYVGSEGLVYKHVCDKVMPDEEHFKSKPNPIAVKLALFLGLMPESTGLGLDAMALPPSTVSEGLSLPWKDP